MELHCHHLLPRGHAERRREHPAVELPTPAPFGSNSLSFSSHLESLPLIGSLISIAEAQTQRDMTSPLVHVAAITITDDYRASPPPKTDPTSFSSRGELLSVLVHFV
jgi:hypothetical protein